MKCYLIKKKFFFRIRSFAVKNVFDIMSDTQLLVFFSQVVIWFLYQIASAVGHIHKAGVLHR